MMSIIPVSLAGSFQLPPPDATNYIAVLKKTNDEEEYVVSIPCGILTCMDFFKCDFSILAQIAFVRKFIT